MLKKITMLGEHFCFSFFCSVKVLILHQHFNTPEKGGAIRSYYLAKALVDQVEFR
jgi:hypothetical protein